MCLVKDDEFTKLFTILEKRRRTKEDRRRSKLRGDEIRPTGEEFDIILTGDQGAFSVQDGHGIVKW